MKLLSGPWPARITWALLPLAMGPALGNALDPCSRPVQVVGSVLAWGTWAKGLVAVALPRTVGLTALRIAAPAALLTAIWSAVVADQGVADVVAVAFAAVTTLAVFSPETGDAFVNGSSYGDERRLALRVPAPLLLGPVPLAWASVVVPAVAGPLLLAAEQWIAGVAVIAAGLPAAAVGVRALHGLSRRWVVFVPAGMVLHDLHAMVDPVLFPRTKIRRVGPAPVDGDGALDLTAGALGLALELELSEPSEVAPRRPDRTLKVIHTRALLFTPSRPGPLLREAQARRIPVGTP